MNHFFYLFGIAYIAYEIMEVYQTLKDKETLEDKCDRLISDKSEGIIGAGVNIKINKSKQSKEGFFSLLIGTLFMVYLIIGYFYADETNLFLINILLSIVLPVCIIIFAIIGTLKNIIKNISGNSVNIKHLSKDVAVEFPSLDKISILTCIAKIIVSFFILYQHFYKS